MTDIADRVFMIQGQDDMIPDAHMYVLGDPEGDDITLVDAGLVGKADYKTASLDRMGVALENVRRIIMTHTHLDHIGCLPELRARKYCFPGITARSRACLRTTWFKPPVNGPPTSPEGRRGLDLVPGALCRGREERSKICCS